MAKNKAGFNTSALISDPFEKVGPGPISYSEDIRGGGIAVWTMADIAKAANAVPAEGEIDYYAVDTATIIWVSDHVNPAGSDGVVPPAGAYHNYVGGTRDANGMISGGTMDCTELRWFNSLLKT